MTEEEKLDGCLGIGETDKDYLLCEGDVDGLPTLFEQDDIIYEYNQANQSWSTKSCTIFSAVGAVSDLMNYQFSLDEIKEIDTMSYRKGRTQGKGWRVQSAVDLVKTWWNNNKELVKKYGKVAYYRVEITNDSLIKSILDKGYDICTGYQGNNKYNTDFTADGVLNGYEFGSKTYAHAVCMRGEGIKDSYKGRSYKGEDRNIYKVAPKWSELVNGGTYYTSGYVFTKVAEDNYEELQRLERVKVLCENALKGNSELWNGTNDKTLQNKLHDLNEYIRNNNLKYITQKKEELR